MKFPLKPCRCDLTAASETVPSMIEKSIVVIGAMRTPPQFDLVRKVSAQPDIEVIGPISDPVELLVTVGNVGADAVVVPLNDDDVEPGLCSHVLAEHPRVLLLALSATARVNEVSACVEKRELSDGEHAALNAIKMARLER